MTTPTLERFLDAVKNHELTIHQNNGVYRHLTFKNPDGYSQYFNITTFPHHLVITSHMGSLIFSTRSSDMFRFFRSDDDDLKINPDYWAEKIQSTSWRAKDASFSEFDIDKIKEYAQEYLDDFLKDNILSKFDKDELIEKFDWKILKSEDEYEIIEKIRNFNCNGFNFVEFSEDDFRVHTYTYIWLCYAIVWGIKKFDEVSQEIKKEKQAKLEKLSEELAKEHLLTRERVKEKQKEELAEIDKAREHAWKEVQIVCGFNEMQLTAGERGVYYGFFLHGWNYAGAYYRKREDSLRLLHHEKVMKLAVSYASLIDDRFALGSK